MDKEVYEIYKDSPVFTKLEAIYGDAIPDYAYDDSALIYSKTEFAINSESDDAIPDDAVIVLKVKPYMWGKSVAKREERNFQYHKELFKKIVGE